jgi:hypothetical protein
MQNTKSRLSIIQDILLRVALSSLFIFLLTLFITLIRGIFLGIESPLQSDDWLWVALFIILWSGIPAFCAVVLSVTAGLGQFKSYLLCVIVELAAFYGYIYSVSKIEGNELASSPLILLVYIAIPLAMIYYPIFFFKKRWILGKWLPL